MTIFTDFHFLRPLLLILLPIVSIIIAMYLRQNSSQVNGWQQVCEPHLLQAMQLESASQMLQNNSSAPANSATKPQKQLPNYLINNKWQYLYYVVAILSVLALAGPSFRKLPLPAVQNQSAWVIALDASQSMLAKDLTPSRLQRAKFAIQDLLKLRPDGQTALIVYSGAAFTASPLTDDKETILNLLSAVQPDVLPVDGKNTLSALNKAEQLLKQSEIASGDIILVTDNIDSNRIKDKVINLASQGFKVSIIAVGSQAGAPIPSDDGFIKDSNGNIVFSKTNMQAMQNIAKLGKGKFVSLETTNNDLAKLVDNNSFNQQSKQQSNQSASQSSNNKNNSNIIKKNNQIVRYADDGYWLLLIILPALFLLYRRGLLLSLLLVSLITTTTFSPRVALADEKSDATSKKEITKKDEVNTPQLSFSDKWFKNQQQLAYKQLLSLDKTNNDSENKVGDKINTNSSEPSKQPDDKSFEDINNNELKAALAYKKQDFKDATKYYNNQIQQPNKKPSGKDYYNLGNAQAQAGQLQAALDSYKKSLDLDPKNANTLYNQKIVADALKKQQQSKDQQSKDQQSKDQQSKDQQSKDQQSKDQQSKDQQSKDQQSKDQQSKEQQSKDQQSKDQQSKDQQSKEQQSKDQQSKEQQSKEQQSKEQQSKEQQSKEQQSKEQQSKEQQSKEQQSKEQQSKEQQSKEQQSKDQQSKDQQSKEQQSKEQQSKDQQSKEQQSKEQQSKDKQGKNKQQPAELTAAEKTDMENAQIKKRFLDQIVNDPSLLMRNQFRQQYQDQQKSKQ